MLLDNVDSGNLGDDISQLVDRNEPILP